MAEPCYDDLRHFLAVAETGTTLAAGRRLKVSQSTVSRRIAALEAATGLELFHKGREGYVLTEAGRVLLDPAREADRAIRAFFDGALAQRRQLSGTVRLTTNEAFASRFMPDLVRKLKAAHPGIRIELATSDRRLDLSRGEADIALRAGSRPTEAGLHGRKIADDRWSLYCSRAYAARHGIPRHVQDLGHHVLVGMDNRITGYTFLDWARDHFPEEAVIIRQNTVPSLLASIRSGLAVGFASDFLARADPEMVCCFTPDVPPPAEIWLLTHARLKGLPHVRAVFDLISAYFARHLAEAGEGKEQLAADHQPCPEPDEDRPSHPIEPTRGAG
jgi:DNA-binding transcriptional LysR family regulator